MAKAKVYHDGTVSGVRRATEPSRRFVEILRNAYALVETEPEIVRRRRASGFRRLSEKANRVARIAVDADAVFAPPSQFAKRVEISGVRRRSQFVEPGRFVENRRGRFVRNVFFVCHRRSLLGANGRANFNDYTAAPSFTPPRFHSLKTDFSG